LNLADKDYQRIFFIASENSIKNKGLKR